MGASSLRPVGQTSFTFDRDRLTLGSSLQAMGVDNSRPPDGTDDYHHIYRANFMDPLSYFFARQFPMRNRGVI
jgi:hypothetical protein